MSKRKPARAAAKSSIATTIALPKKEKTLPAASGLNSMTNWLLALVLVLPLLVSKASMDPTITIRYIFLGGFTLLFLIYFFADAVS